MYQADMAAISALDLDPVKLKLQHAQSGEGWDGAKADAVEFEYRRFLYLMKNFPAHDCAPLADVDTFWHYHILDTMKYMQDCEAVFGHYLHHYPYVGIGTGAGEGEQARAGARMQALYEQVFGEGSFAEASRRIDGGRAPGGDALAWCVMPPDVRRPATAWSVMPPDARQQSPILPGSYLPEANAASAARTSG